MTTIRPVQEKDIKETAALFSSVVDTLLNECDGPTRDSYKSKYSPENLRAFIQDPDSLHLISLDDAGRITGFIFGWQFHGTGNIHWTGVDPEHRSKGIAKELTEAAIDRFRKGGCYRIELFTYTGDKSAEGFFSKFGFRTVSKIDENFCKMPVLRMELGLRKPTEEEKTVKIIISGGAGQGIKLGSTILASILAELDRHVTLNIEYGPSVRGGKMHAELIYSDDRITNPFIEKADILVRLAEEGDDFPAKRTISNQGLAKGEEIPFTGLAQERFGSPVFVNMLALGKLLRAVGANIEKINLESNLPPRFVEKNVAAIQFGYQYRDGA